MLPLFLQKRAKIFTDCESKLFLHTVIEKKKKEIIEEILIWSGTWISVRESLKI
jgi:hypothetical protein